VTRSGNSYIALLANTGAPVSSTSDWALFAQKGATGPAGPAGPRGEGANVGTWDLTLGASADLFVTNSFSAPANATCVVTSALSTYVLPSNPLPIPAFLSFGYYNAMSDDGVASYSTFTLAVLSNGSVGQQHEEMLSSTFSIVAGHKYAFGVHLDTLEVNGYGGVQLTYDCA
jgi:hypothetical protein